MPLWLLGMVVDGRYLGLGGGDGDGCIAVNAPDLAMDTLEHRLQAAILTFEKLDELL